MITLITISLYCYSIIVGSTSDDIHILSSVDCSVKVTMIRLKKGFNRENSTTKILEIYKNVNNSIFVSILVSTRVE